MGNLEAARRQGMQVLAIDVLERVGFTGGGAEGKYRITGVVSDPGGQRRISLIERASRGGGRDILPYTLAYFQKWTEFKRVGLPVVASVWASEEGALFVTDVKADGSETYG